MQRSVALTLRWFVLSCVSLAAACAGPSRPLRPQPAPAPVLAADSILAPSRDPMAELEALAQSHAPESLLRRAWLELQVGHAQAAIDLAAQVLYASEPPSANAEAFARYLRAEAHLRLGQRERGEYDRTRARELALDSGLQRLLGPAPREAPAAPNANAAPSAGAAQFAGVLPRATWRPQAVDRAHLDPMGAPRQLTIHHSAMYFRDTRTAACATQIHLIQREHMGNRGYGDIGYHFLIDPAGRVWEGRELRWQGAHASGDNNIRNIGICVLGNFVRGRDGHDPTPAQVASMRALVEQLMVRYRIGADAIHCHSHFKATVCPGPLMEAVVARMQRELRQNPPVAANDAARRSVAAAGSPP